MLIGQAILSRGVGSVFKSEPLTPDFLHLLFEAAVRDRRREPGRPDGPCSCPTARGSATSRSCTTKPGRRSGATRSRAGGRERTSADGEEPTYRPPGSPKPSAACLPSAPRSPSARGASRDAGARTSCSRPTRSASAPSRPRWTRRSWIVPQCPASRRSTLPFAPLGYPAWRTAQQAPADVGDCPPHRWAGKVPWG